MKGRYFLMKKERIFQSISSVVLLIACVFLLTLFHPCSKHTMQCNTTSFYCLLLMVVCFILSSINIYITKQKNSMPYYLTLSVIIIGIGFFLLISPDLFGGCMKSTMRCQSLTFPFVRVIALAIMILQFFGMSMLPERK